MHIFLQTDSITIYIRDVSSPIVLALKYPSLMYLSSHVASEVGKCYQAYFRYREMRY